ncbi:hypothetical protein CPB85DRAFT_291316 [Mucidula mucida]|nr:hypothetical protein CPB85DRAFT_291316 [Mucidula mucida]
MRSITDKYIGGESSLRRLPNEILLEIFEQYVGFNPEPYRVFHTDRGPWKLRQVCRKWRQLASSWPRLWSRFVFHNQDVYRPDARCFPLHRLDLLRTTILLSAPRSLSIKIVMDKDYEYVTRDTTNEVLGILKGVSEKWESFDAEWYARPSRTTTLNEWLHNLEHGKLPLLKRLATRIHTYEVNVDYHYYPKPITAFASAPDNNFDFISLPYWQLLDFHCVEIYDRNSDWPETPFIRRTFVDMLDNAAVPKLRAFSYKVNASNVFARTVS